MVQGIQKTDPRVRIGMLEQAERELLKQVQDSEETLRRLLAELRATRRLLEEAQGDLSQAQQEEITHRQEEINNQTQVLEEVLAQSVTERQVQEENSVVQQNVASYQNRTTQTANKIETAASQDTIDKLMRLAYTDNWSQQQAQEFFTLKDTITQTMGYDLNPALKQTVDQSYAALQTVEQRASNQIKDNYDPNSKPKEDTTHTVTQSTSVDNNYKPKKSSTLESEFKNVW